MEELPGLATSPFPLVLTPGQVPLLALKHLGAEGAGSQVEGTRKEQSHCLRRMQQSRFRFPSLSLS
eukprot:911479-Rhodomonas_salina.1